MNLRDNGDVILQRETMKHMRIANDIVTLLLAGKVQEAFRILPRRTKMIRLKFNCWIDDVPPAERIARDIAIENVKSC